MYAKNKVEVRNLRPRNCAVFFTGCWSQSWTSKICNISKARSWNKNLLKTRVEKCLFLSTLKGIKTVQAGGRGQKVAKLCPRSCWMTLIPNLLIYFLESMQGIGHFTQFWLVQANLDLRNSVFLKSKVVSFKKEIHMY